MFCALNQLNKVWHVWPGSNDFHWMCQTNWPVELDFGGFHLRAKGNEIGHICQTNWPVELDLEELFFHLRAKGNEIGQHSSRDRTPVDSGPKVYLHLFQ